MIFREEAGSNGSVAIVAPKARRGKFQKIFQSTALLSSFNLFEMWR